MVLLAIYVLVAFLVDHGILVLPERDGDILPVGIAIRDAVFVMLMLIIVGSVPYVHRQQRSSPLRLGLWLLGCVVAAAFCLGRCASQTLIYNLVHIATLGIDYAMPGNRSAINANLYNVRILWFFWLSLLVVMIVVANWAILARLAGQWSRGIGRRLLWIGFLVAGVAATSLYLLWVYTRALWQISPYFAAAGYQVPLHCWFASSLLILILTTMLTYRLGVNRDQQSDMPQVAWRQNTTKYYHERWWLLLLLAITSIWFRLEIYRFLLEFVNQNNMAIFHSKWTFNWFYLLGWWFDNPINFLWLSLIILAFQRAFARRDDPHRPQTDLPRIAPARFIAVWLGTLAVILSSVPTLVWVNFAFWFNPWWRSR